MAGLHGPRGVVAFILSVALPLLIVGPVVIGAPTGNAQGEPAAAPKANVSVDDETGGEAVECAVLETNLGEITVRFYPDVAPKAVENFQRLARKGYYEGVIFHRVIDGFMIQGGDPTGTGYGGRSIWEVPFEDEFSPRLRFDRKGLLAMANTGPRSNGSQFFISLAPTEWLNDKHTIFGEVVDGMDVVDLIGQVEIYKIGDKRDRPVEDVVIQKIRFEERVLEP